MQKQQKHSSSCTYRNTMTHIRSLYTSLLSLFITGCLCGSDLTVWQTPKIINATEGQHVNISCHFTIKSIKSTWVQLSIAWWRNNETKEVQQELYNNSALNSDSVNHSSVLQIPSVHLNDSGIYYCKVWKHIPTLGEKINGSGTELRVDVVPPQGSNATTPTNHSAVTVIGASVLSSVLITVLITCVIFIIYRGCCKRPKQQSKGESAPAEEASSVLYAALNIRKPQEKKNTQEVSPQPDTECPTDAGRRTDAGCLTDCEVLYSDVRIKKQKQRQTVLSDTT